MLLPCHARDCISVKQRSENVYYISRYNKSLRRVFGVFKMKILAKLRKPEKEILELKGKKREEAMEAYRKLLISLKDKPIYFVRY